MSKYSQSKYHKRAAALRLQNKKYCSDCKSIKDFKDFWKNKSNIDGLHNKCKLCADVANKKYKKRLMLEDREKEILKRDSIKRKNYTGYIYSQLKYAAKSRKLDFNLSKEDIIVPTHCPVFGYELNFERKGIKLPNSPSVDRIDNNKGYIKGNVQIISWRANRIKADASVEELEILLKYMKRETNEKPITKNVGDDVD